MAQGIVDSHKKSGCFAKNSTNNEIGLKVGPKIKISTKNLEISIQNVENLAENSNISIKIAQKIGYSNKNLQKMALKT